MKTAELNPTFKNIMKAFLVTIVALPNLDFIYLNLFLSVL